MRTGTEWNDAGDGFAHLSQQNPDLLKLMAAVAQARASSAWPGTLQRLIVRAARLSADAHQRYVPAHGGRA